MGKWGFYGNLQLKRMFSFMPAVFLTSILLFSAAILGIGMLIKAKQESPDYQKIKLAVVGDAEESYLGMGLAALKEFDGSRYTLDLTAMDLEEARENLRSGRISGYLEIPEDFVKSVVRGENKKVSLVTGGNQAQVGTILAMELADAVSCVLTESQAGIYTFQDLYLEQGFSRDVMREKEKVLNLEYFRQILDRESAFQVMITGETQGASVEEYYTCAFLLLFFMLWGISFGFLWIKKDYTLYKVLHRRNLNAGMQVIGEMAACLCMNLSIFMILFLFLFFLLKITGSFVQINQEISLSVLGGFGIRILPVLIFLLICQMLLYEWTNHLVTGILINFLGAVVFGGLSGCFCPVEYFPEVLQRVGEFLPFKLALEYMLLAVKGEDFFMAVGILGIYTLAAVGILVGIRKYRIAR